MHSVLSETLIYVLLSRLNVPESKLLRHYVISTSNYFPTFRRIVVLLSSGSSNTRRIFRLLEHEGKAPQPSETLITTRIYRLTQCVYPRRLESPSLQL